MDSEVFSKDLLLSDYKRNEHDEMIIAPPLDFSFKKASSMDELAEKRPQTIRTGKLPNRTIQNYFTTSSVWLSNNSLTSIKGLESFLRKFVGDPTNLCWLDLSFNEIEEIADEITNLSNLKILYMHGNNIKDMNQVVKFRKLRSLRSLTLHGNPIESIPCYRGYVVHLLPELASLDFSTIIAAEKKRARPLGFQKTIRNNI